MQLGKALDSINIYTLFLRTLVRLILLFHYCRIFRKNSFFANYEMCFSSSFKTNFHFSFVQKDLVGHSFPSKEQVSFTSWLQLPSAVILEPPNIKSLTVSIVSPSICHEVMGPDAMNLVFLILSFKPFSLSSKGFLVLHFLP